MANPFQNRDLHTILRFPTLSWSSLSAFRDYDKDKWYKRYVLGIQDASNPAMDAGRVIGEKLATDPNFLPQVPRPEVYEQSLRGKLHKIDLVGHLDGWSPSVPELLEYKTTQNRRKWTCESVDSHGQIDFYCLLIWLNFKIPPEKLKISLTVIHLVEDGEFHLKPTGQIEVIPTTRTMADILKFGVHIKAIHKEMQEYVANQLAIV